MAAFVVSYSREGHESPHGYCRQVCVNDDAPSITNLRDMCAFVLGTAWGSVEIKTHTSPYWNIRGEHLTATGARFELYNRPNGYNQRSYWCEVVGEITPPGPW